MPSLFHVWLPLQCRFLVVSTGKCIGNSRLHDAHRRIRKRFRSLVGISPVSPPRYPAEVADSLDLDALIERFRERAKAVRNRTLPPVEGAERQRIKERAQQDFLDYALIGDATASVDDGILTLRVDLRGGS